jgi:hypothetical protein
MTPRTEMGFSKYSSLKSKYSFVLLAVLFLALRIDTYYASH